MGCNAIIGIGFYGNGGVFFVQTLSSAKKERNDLASFYVISDSFNSIYAKGLVGTSLQLDDFRKGNGADAKAAASIRVTLSDTFLKLGRVIAQHGE